MEHSKSHPLISIVTPVYNAEKFLQATLESVLAQSYSNWEQLLVVDSNSSDQSLEIALNYSRKDPRFVVLQSPQYKGVTANRNAALAYAKGDYIAFLDSDDLWAPQKLEKQLSFMRNKNSVLSCHEYQPIDELGALKGPVRKVPTQIRFSDLLNDNSMGCLTVMVQKKFLGSRRFPNLKHEDLALWLELLKSDTCADGLSEPLAFYRVQSTSLSGNKFKSALWRWKIYRYLDLSYAKSISHLVQYAVSAVRKRI